MTHHNIAHRRTHNLLLISKLLGTRDFASPFTLVFDTLEQTAGILVNEYIRRAGLAKTNVIYLGFDTVRRTGVDSFIPCYDKSFGQVASSIADVKAKSSAKRHLIIIDSLHSLCCAALDGSIDLASFFSSLLAPISSVQVSMVAVYHADIPLPSGRSQYQPSPLAMLSYLATSLITVHSLPVLVSAKLAQEKSQVAPSYGLSEEKEGVLVGLKPTKFQGSALRDEDRGLILELEHRRKSGRGVHEWYFLPSKSVLSSAQNFRETVILLDDHPLFRRQQSESQEPELGNLTFELGLTDRQKLERDGVVLPYFDAQRGGGPGEGGRILYDMGSEDDFDEEEDEI